MRMHSAAEVNVAVGGTWVAGWTRQVEDLQPLHPRLIHHRAASSKLLRFRSPVTSSGG